MGASDDLAMRNGHPVLRGLAAVEALRPTLSEGVIALLLLVDGFALASIGWVPLPIGLLGAVTDLIAFGIVPMQEACRKVDWRLLVMIAAMTRVGLSLHASGAAEVVASEPLTLLTLLLLVALIPVACPCILGRKPAGARKNTKDIHRIIHSQNV